MGTFAVWPGQHGARPHPPLAPLPPRPQAYVAGAPAQQQQFAGPLSVAGSSSYGFPTPTSSWTWDPQALASNFNTMTLTPPPGENWYMDSGASSHMVSNSDRLTQVNPSTSFTPSNIIVGNGSTLPVTTVGSTSFHLPNSSLHLHNVLISPHIIKDLISVRRFTIDNHCSVEFDPFGLSVKDLATGNMIIRCNSIGELYSFRPSPNHHSEGSDGD
jgi:hypothetical protein